MNGQISSTGVLRKGENCFELVICEGLQEEGRIKLVLWNGLNFFDWIEKGIMGAGLDMRRYTLSLGNRKNSAIVAMEC